MSVVIKFPAKARGGVDLDPAAYANDLSFMKKLSRKERKGRLFGIDFWTVTPTGDRGQDWSRGKQLAHEFLAYVIANPTYGNLTLFHHIVIAIHDKAKAEGRELNAVELGFLKSVGIHAVAAAAAGLSDRMFD